MTGLRGAIVGTGRIAGIKAPTELEAPVRTHAQGLRRHGIQLAAICDPGGEGAAAFAERWGVPAIYGALGDMLERETPLDVVVIASPDGLHATQAETVLAAARPPRLLILEKPPATTPEDLGRLLACAVARPEVTVAVNLSRRFDSGHAALAELIAKGTLGPLRQALFTYYGGWLHNGIHAVDTLRFLLDGEFEIASVRPGAPGHDGDPCLDVAATCAGVPVRLDGFDEAQFQLFELELRFAAGRVRLEDFGQRIMAEKVEANSIGERELGQPFVIGKTVDRTPMDLLYEAGRRFLETGHDKALERSSLQQAAQTMKVLFDAQRR